MICGLGSTTDDHRGETNYHSFFHVLRGCLFSRAASKNGSIHRYRTPLVISHTKFWVKANRWEQRKGEEKTSLAQAKVRSSLYTLTLGDWLDHLRRGRNCVLFGGREMKSDYCDFLMGIGAVLLESCIILAFVTSSFWLYSRGKTHASRTIHAHIDC